MKIALLAPFEESVPPKKYGGTELVVYNLAQTLENFGHKVFLLASGDSKIKGELISIFPEAVRKDPAALDMKIRETYKYIGISRVLEELKKIKPDIIHNHIGWRFIPFEKQFNCPVVTTLHGQLDIPHSQFFFKRYAKSNYISISNNQREPLDLNYIATVYNGIDTKSFKFYRKPGDYLAFLGRMSPEKGPVMAIKIAKKFGLKLKMAAKIDSFDKDYYSKEIRPLIDGKQIEFIGEISANKKNNFLGNASALLAPIQAREPFGLFIVEAMASGTPVVATNMGSAKELIIKNKTGFLAENNVGDFVSALKKIGRIDRRECFEHVRKNFTKETMTLNYIKAYEKIISSADKKAADRNDCFQYNKNPA